MKKLLKLSAHNLKIDFAIMFSTQRKKKTSYICFWALNYVGENRPTKISIWTTLLFDSVQSKIDLTKVMRMAKNK